MSTKITIQLKKRCSSIMLLRLLNPSLNLKQTTYYPKTSKKTNKGTQAPTMTSTYLTNLKTIENSNFSAQLRWWRRRCWPSIDALSAHSSYPASTTNLKTKSSFPKSQSQRRKSVKCPPKSQKQALSRSSSTRPTKASYPRYPSTTQTSCPITTWPPWTKNSQTPVFSPKTAPMCV